MQNIVILGNELIHVLKHDTNENSELTNEMAP